MNVTILDPATHPSWATLTSERSSDVFHSPQWMRVLRRTYGFEPRAVLIERDGHPVAGIPFCEISDIHGDRVISLPFSDSCDPLVSDSEEWDTVAGALMAYGHPVNVRVLHSTIPLEDPRFTAVGRARWHGIDLDGHVEDIWARIDSSARRAIRKARAEGLQARPAKDKGELRDFFELHLRTRKYKYGMLAQPYAFFETMWDEFVEAGDGFLMVALKDGAVVGGIFFLEWKGALHYKFNASNPDYVNLRPNDLALWTAIEQGVAAGCRRIDFGLSDWNQEGLVRYKRKYATAEGTITNLQSQPAHGASNDRDEVRAVLSTVARLLTAESVSDEITEQAGNELYRYFA